MARAAHHVPGAVLFIMPALSAFNKHPEIALRLRKGSLFVKVGRQSYTLFRDRETQTIGVYCRADPSRRRVTKPLNLRAHDIHGYPRRRSFRVVCGACGC